MELMATRTHALYRLIDRPQEDAAHGGCYLTGSQGQCIDTGVLIDQEGTLTISVAALQELCEVAGFSFNAEGIRLEEEVARLGAQIVDLSTERDDLRDQLDAVGIAVARAAGKKK